MASDEQLDDGLNPRSVFGDDGELIGYGPAPGEYMIVHPNDPSWHYGFVPDGDLSVPQVILDEFGRATGETYQEHGGHAVVRVRKTGEVVWRLPLFWD